ncbi:MAG: hypothetical protein JW839_00220 [Candidatus Lokiarchaeota archaeon]|nr:hypothetical protein [Candidatus Lokiarchaeota archaeon]
MAKEALILKVLLDGIPRTIPEIAASTGMSDTYCLTLCGEMSGNGAINLRKSAGTWIAWRVNVRGTHEHDLVKSRAGLVREARDTEENDG